jgi:hypothetical protein
MEEIFWDSRSMEVSGYLAEGADRYRVKVHCYPDGESFESGRNDP